MTLNIQRVWTARKEELGGASGVRCEIDLNSQPVTVADVLEGWQHDPRFRAFFNSLLAYETFAEFRWETPRVTTDTLTNRFEFVSYSRARVLHVRLIQSRLPSISTVPLRKS